MKTRLLKRMRMQAMKSAYAKVVRNTCNTSERYIVITNNYGVWWNSERGKYCTVYTKYNRIDNKLREDLFFARECDVRSQVFKMRDEMLNKKLRNL